MDRKSYYFDCLYPFQDEVLHIINGVETGFYLTGGTALSRAYLQHRFSDDLDLFVNFDAHFGEWAERLVDALWREGESRDLADVWGLCQKLGLSLKDALSGAQSKSSGIYPADLARRLCEASPSDWEAVMWIDAPNCEAFLTELQTLGEKLIVLPN